MKQKEAVMPAQILHDLGQLPPRRTEALVDILRSHILTGELPPGQRLNLDEIAQQSGVSRMPVRDALKQLEAEGLVNIYPQRGIEVSALNIEDITQLFGIRIVLEQKAVELAIPRLTSEDHAIRSHARDGNRAAPALGSLSRMRGRRRGAREAGRSRPFLDNYKRTAFCVEGRGQF